MARCIHAVRANGIASRCFLDDDRPHTTHRARARKGDVLVLTWQTDSPKDFITDRADAWAWTL